MSNKKLIFILVPLLVLLGLAVYYLPYKNRGDSVNTNINTNQKYFASQDLGLSFQYPEEYFLEVKNVKPADSVLILTEDTLENQQVREGLAPGREGPVSITVAVYHNDHDDGYSAEQWIQDNENSNFKLSDGLLVPLTIDHKTALSYHWSGLYEADNVVIAVGPFIYSFVVTYLTQNNAIRSDFKEILESVIFL